MMVIAIPLEVAEQLDEDLSEFVEDPRLDEDEDEASPSETRRTVQRRPFWVGSTIPREEPPSDDDDAARQADGPSLPGRPVPVHPGQPPQPVGRGDGRAGPTPRGRSCSTGPSPSGRTSSRSSRRAGAGRPSGSVLQGMQEGKQIEMFTPLALGRDSASRTVIAVWIYQDTSMAVVHLDFQDKERYILWDAPDAHQFNYENAEELRIRLSTMNLEVPDQLDRILSKK